MELGGYREQNFSRVAETRKMGGESCLDKPAGGSDGAGPTATPSALTLWP